MWLFVFFTGLLLSEFCSYELLDCRTALAFVDLGASVNGWHFDELLPIKQNSSLCL